MVPRPDYNSLNEALDKAEAEFVAAECHGALCGMICAAGKVELADWLEQIFAELDMNNMLIQEASQLLVGLYHDTQTQLNDSTVDFQLLLPEDDVALVQRSEALGAWCQGFTFGLASGGLRQDRELPEDTAELLRDMVEIARVGHDAEDSNDSDEDAYMQLYEYVRMGVLLINEELQPSHSAHTTLQ